MRKLFNSGFVAATMIGITVLAGCSSGGSSESGLGLNVAGQWRGQLIERRSGRAAGLVSLLIQSDANTVSLNPLFAGNQTVTGSVAFENILTDDCPIRSFVGTIDGTIVGNELVMSGETDDFFITLSGITSDNRISGDWNMSLDFTVDVPTGKVDEDDIPETEEQDRRCQNFGTWTATKINT